MLQERRIKMKRSEMIKILQESILNHMNCHGCCRSDSEMYHKILKSLEDSGMLPPFSGKMAAVSDEVDAPGHEWEPE